MAKKAKSGPSMGARLKTATRWFHASDRVNRGLNGVLAALLVVGVLGGGIFGLRYLDEYVNRLSVFTHSEVSVCLYDQPRWMSESLAREILTDSFKPIHDRLVRIHREGKDHELPRVLALQLAKNAWVSKVRWIRRGYGGQFVINATFREPTALVNLGPWCYLIDGAGYLLPGKYKYDAVSACGLVEIEGVAGSAPATGTRWSRDDLQAGLELAKLVTPLPFRSQIRAVDVSNFQGRDNPAAAWMVLTTDRGTTIRWGKPAGEERGLENSAAQKINLLAGIYQMAGHIDFGRQYVDVRRSAHQVDASIAAAHQTEQE